MSKKKHVTIRVLYYPGRCSGSCCMATRMSSHEEIDELWQKCNELKEALEAANPGQTSVELVDLQLTPEEKATEAGLLLVNGQYPAPLVIIDGQPRFAGSIDINRIVTEVGKILNG